MDKTPPPRLQPGDVITALPIPREVTAVRGLRAVRDPGKLVWVRSHDGWRARGIGAGRLSAAALLHNYPGGLIVVEVTPEAAPEPTPDVEPEPPVGSKRTDREGYVWTRFPEGWWVMPRAESAPHIALSWEQVQAQCPLQEPCPGDIDRNPEPTPEPLPTVTDTDGGTWAEVAPDRWRRVYRNRRTLDRIRARCGGTTSPDGRTHTSALGVLWVLLPDGWAATWPATERPRADIPRRQPSEPTTPEPEQAPEPEQLAEPDAVALLCALRDGLSKLGRGALTAWSWDGETLTVTATSYPPHRNVLDGARVLANGEPRLTPDGVLVWTAAGYVGDGPGVPMRVLWAPERTTGGVL